MRTVNSRDEHEIFTIPARRCKRCGGLLTSAQALRDGYGPCCLRKMKQEAREREEAKNQYSLFPGEGAGSSSPLNGACVTGLSPYGHCGAAAYCPEPYDCCAACQKPCNIRCGWLKKEGDPHG